MKMTKYLLKSSITGALGGLLFGFDTAVIAGTTQQLTAVYHLTSFTLGLTVAIGLVGTVVGAMSAGVVGQRIGGREALRILAVLYTISALGCALAWNWPALMVFRFIGGLGVRTASDDVVALRQGHLPGFPDEPILHGGLARRRWRIRLGHIADEPVSESVHGPHETRAVGRVAQRSPNFGNQTCKVRLEDERRRPELLLQLASRHGTGTILDEQQKQLKCLR